MWMVGAAVGACADATRCRPDKAAVKPTMLKEILFMLFLGKRQGCV
jgi:hypothetical protein